MVLIGATCKYRHTDCHAHTNTHSQPALFKCSPDSMWSSDRTVLPPLVVRSCLKDQSGEVIQTETERERGSLSFMMLLSPLTKMLCFFSSVQTDVTSKCCWHLCQILQCFLSLSFRFSPTLYSHSVCLFPPVYLHLFLFLLILDILSSLLHYLLCNVLSLVLFFCAVAVLPPCLSLSRFLCLCLAAGVFLKNNKVWGCACACVLRWLRRRDGLAALGWLLVWSPGKLYDLFS